MKNILFVCTGNTCRSPMAQALFIEQWQKKYNKPISEEFKVRSAGLSAPVGMRASNQAIEVMKEIGIDLSQHRTNSLGADLVREADYIFTMTEGHTVDILHIYPGAGEVYLLSKFAINTKKDVIDPYGEGLEIYRKTRVQLEGLINGLIEKLMADDLP